jgi:hypothetical protein
MPSFSISYRVLIRFPYFTDNSKIRDRGERRRKILYQNQGWEPIHQKYKAKESTSKHNPKKKQKQIIKKNKKQTLCK